MAERVGTQRSTIQNPSPVTNTAQIGPQNQATQTPVHDDGKAAQHTTRHLPPASKTSQSEGWAGSAFPTFTIGSLSYTTPGVNDFLQEAWALDQNGSPKEAIEIYDLILESHPNNADAKNRKAIALGHLARAEVDERSPHNESAQSVRHARRFEEQGIALLEEVVQAACDAGIYNPETNTLSMPNVNKYNGNEDLRGLFSALPKALYNLAASKTRLANLCGQDPYETGALAAISTAAGIKTDLGDASVVDRLRRESSWHAASKVSVTHNQAVDKTIDEARTFALSLSSTFKTRLSEDADFGAMRRQPAFQTAIAKA